MKTAAARRITRRAFIGVLAFSLGCAFVPPALASRAARTDSGSAKAEQGSRENRCTTAVRKLPEACSNRLS
jgi:hypothetical protein